MGWVLAVVATVVSSVTVVIHKDFALEFRFPSLGGGGGLGDFFITKCSYILIFTTTLISGGAFSVSCLAIYFDLEAFYSVDPKYKNRVL